MRNSPTADGFPRIRSGGSHGRVSALWRLFVGGKRVIRRARRIDRKLCLIEHVTHHDTCGGIRITASRASGRTSVGWLWCQGEAGFLVLHLVERGNAVGRCMGPGWGFQMPQGAIKDRNEVFG